MPNDCYERVLKQASDSFFSLPGAGYVTYYPKSGSARRIRAVIERPGEMEAGREVVLILVKNSTTSGIASAQINTGGDKVEVSQRDNKRPIRMKIAEILNHDAAMLKLKLI